MTAVVQLGNSQLSVSRLGLGCLSMSGNYGPRQPEAESIATINRALDLGINLLDTADMYGAGHNEELIGRAIRGRRPDAVVATKFGNIFNANGRPVALNAHPSYVPIACDASLQRLQIDEIDLYYLHRVDPKVPIEETVGAMADLVAAGKVKSIGLSEASAETLRRAHKVWPVTALQTEYSLWFRPPEDSSLPVCRELGTTFVAYAPLGRGMLTGTLDDPDLLEGVDNRRNHPRFQSENFNKNREAVGRIVRVANKRGVTAAQVALAWLLGKGPGIVPIPGAKSIRHLDENTAAMVLELTDSESQELESSFPAGTASGERYPEPDLAVVDG